MCTRRHKPRYEFLALTPKQRPPLAPGSTSAPASGAANANGAALFNGSAAVPNGLSGGHGTC